MLAKRQTKSLILIIGLFSLIGLAWGWPILASQGPTAITIDYFEGYWVDEAVEIEWGTGTELNTQGFQIHRAESVTQPTDRFDGFEHIVVEVDGELYGPGFFTLIPSVGDGVVGGDYLAYDDDVEEGFTYWYIIAEQEGSGLIFYDDPAMMLQVVTVDGTPTPTPVGIGGGSTNTPTPIATATQTSAATATQTSGGGTNPTATATIIATQSSGGGTNPTATSFAASPTPMPSATAVAGGDNGGGSGSAQPTATLANSSSPGGADGNGQPIAQITGTPDPNAYPQPGAEPTEQFVGEEVYPDGVEPTATAYPVGELPAGGDNGIGSDTTGQPESGTTSDFLGNGNSNTDSSEFLNGTIQQGETQSRERLLLWIGFIAALLVFAGGMFGFIILFTRRKA